MTTPRRFELTEYQAARLRLTREQIDYLEQHFGEAVELWKHASGGRVWIRVRSRVGTIAGPGLELRIRPKCGARNLYAMLAYALPLARLQTEIARRAETEDVREFLLVLFAEAIEELLRGGIRRGYVEREEDLGALRGRLMLEEEVRRLPGSRLHFRCRHQDYTADVPDNQVIRFTLERVGGVGNPLIDARLSRLRLAFAHCTRRRFRVSEIEGLRYDRLNQHYQQVHALCALILAGLGADEAGGEHEMGTFLVNMDAVFERFVASWLAAHASGRWEIRRQYSCHLDRGRELGLRPDIVLADDAGPRLVADTKYKLGTGRPSSADTYQALAYCRALGVRNACLIYPERRSSRWVVRDGENEIAAEGIEIDKPWGKVEEGMRALMEILIGSAKEAQGRALRAMRTSA